MVEERIAYGIEKFLEEDFFLPENDSYCLEEKSESGRSELQVTIQGDNLCCEDYDHKGKCNFLKRESPLKLQRSVDHVLLQKKDGKWVLHLIEMKSKVDDKKWHEIKQKTRASYFNVCALKRVLGIHIDEVEVYTTYETTGFWHSEQSEDPKIIVPLLGKPLPPKPESEWENHRISVDVGEIVQFHHHAVKMQRTEDGRKLIGELNIQ